MIAGIMPSFDIVSKVQWSEVDNALQQADKEIAQRFDFKDTKTEVILWPPALKSGELRTPYSAAKH